MLTVPVLTVPVLTVPVLTVPVLTVPVVTEAEKSLLGGFRVVASIRKPRISFNPGYENCAMPPGAGARARGVAALFSAHFRLNGSLLLLVRY